MTVDIPGVASLSKVRDAADYRTAAASYRILTSRDNDVVCFFIYFSNSNRIFGAAAKKNVVRFKGSHQKLIDRWKYFLKKYNPLKIFR